MMIGTVRLSIELLSVVFFYDRQSSATGRIENEFFDKLHLLSNFSFINGRINKRNYERNPIL